MRQPATTLSLMGLYVCFGAVAVVSQTMQSHVLALSALLAAFLIAFSTIDIADGILPDILTRPLIGIGLISAWWFQFDWVVWRALSAAVGAAVIVAINLVYRRLKGGMVSATEMRNCLLHPVPGLVWMPFRLSCFGPAARYCW